MSLNKSAFRRYLVIAKTLRRTDRFYLKSREDLQHAILNEMGMRVSLSTIDKDICEMRHDSDLRLYAPIKARHGGRTKGASGYYIDDDWDFFDALRHSWG
jgi:hypothetical protein